MTNNGLWLAALICALPASGAAQSSVQGPPRLTRDALMAKYRDPAGKVLTLGGIEVYYQDEGRGPVILMVHGSVSTLKTYDGEVAALKGRYRIIRYDVPPGGLSGSVSDKAAAAMKPVDVAEGLLTALGVKSVALVGVSSGGTLCIQLAAKRPDLVNHLILSNTPADPVDTSHLQMPPSFIAEQKEAARTHGQSLGFWNAFMDFFSGAPARITPQIRQQYYDFNRRTPEKHPIDLVAQVADHGAAAAAMGAVTAPTLLIWGAKDPLLTPATAEALRRYLTHAQVSLLFMPDVGHFPRWRPRSGSPKSSPAILRTRLRSTRRPKGAARPGHRRLLGDDVAVSLRTTGAAAARQGSGPIMTYRSSVSTVACIGGE